MANPCRSSERNIEWNSTSRSSTGTGASVARPGETLQDGERFNLPMRFMDAEARAVADALAQKYGRFHTHFSDGTPDHTSPHKPGYRFADIDDAAKIAADEAYEERSRRMETAWQRKGEQQQDASAAPCVRIPSMNCNEMRKPLTMSATRECATRGGTTER